MDLTLVVALVAIAGWGVTLVRHVMFKRDFYRLKEDMKAHTLTNGIDNELWAMFVERSRKMLSFWR